MNSSVKSADEWWSGSFCWSKGLESIVQKIQRSFCDNYFLILQRTTYQRCWLYYIRVQHNCSSSALKRHFYIPEPIQTPSRVAEFVLRLFCGFHVRPQPYVLLPEQRLVRTTFRTKASTNCILLYIITFTEALLDENRSASAFHPNNIQTVWLWAPTAAKTVKTNNINSTWIPSWGQAKWRL